MYEPNAIGFCLCTMALNALNNPSYFSVNANIQQSIDYQYRMQRQVMQSQIDTLRYQMLQTQLQSQMIQSFMPRRPKEPDVFELDKILFPDNPIRDWREKRCGEIEDKYKWLNIT